ncbi:CCA tRNA nucleotidyltransferase [Clostridium butyricum]|uniref:CCA tRNA nucleotidyltransferase n=1 Tax=Clostridium butyricum TaxID=1492 RepID=UPI001BA6BF54|nr:polynucleotide adenylyltransferase [Clostridium butyricum]QUF82007.1 polynucleotide adenylyltransferase [Clostridium butyricum]
MNYKLKIPSDVQYIINVLIENGYEGYMVGGCVRDLLINREPNDYDITTNAKPEVVARLFDKVILTGLKHGTVTVVINKVQYEVTTYREDGEYKDSRHPENVKFVTNIKKDLSRRDFTINAMAYNKEKGLIDYFDGLSDLKNKVIRTVGNPEKRFTEDSLRMLRAVRFAVQLDFKIEESIIQSIKILNNNLEFISKERIREEFNKIILKDPNGLKLLHECSILKYIADDLDKAYDYYINDKIKCYNLYEHLILSSCNIKKDLSLRLTMLFHDLGKLKDWNNKLEKVDNIFIESACIAEKILRSLKYDNGTIKKVKTLITYMHSDLEDKVSIKKLLNIIDVELFEDLIKVKKAHIMSENIEEVKFLNIEKLYCDILEKNECFRIRDMKINGEDIIKIGVKKGKDVGTMLNYLLCKVIEDNNLNYKKKLLELAEDKLSMNI